MCIYVFCVYIHISLYYIDVYEYKYNILTCVYIYYYNILTSYLPFNIKLKFICSYYIYNNM